MDRELGVCPAPGCSIRTRRSNSGAWAYCLGSDSRATKKADAFIASILHGFLDAHAKVVPNPLSATPGRIPRPTLDSWENYMEELVIWIDAGPSLEPDPGAVVQWFSFVPRSPSLSSDHVASSPSHFSNSIKSHDFDTPSSVPSTVPEGPADCKEGSFGDGRVESGRATRREGSAVSRLPSGYRHPRNIYNVSGDTHDFECVDSFEPARRS